MIAHSAEIKIQGSRRRNDAIRKITACSTLPSGVVRTIIQICQLLNSHCDYGIAWPSETLLAKKTGYDVRTIKRHIKIIKALGIFTIKQMGSTEAREYCLTNYGYSIQITKLQRKLNFYIPNSDHSLWQSCRDLPAATVQEMGLLAREQAAAKAQLVAAGRGGTTEEEQEAVSLNELSVTRMSLLNSDTDVPRSLLPIKSGRADANHSSPVREASHSPGEARSLYLQDRAATPQGRQTEPTSSVAGMKLQPAINPRGFQDFLAKWKLTLPRSADFSPKDLEEWSSLWDSEPTFHQDGAAEFLLDLIVHDDFYAGRKAGRSGKPFIMQPNYLLGLQDGQPRWRLALLGQLGSLQQAFQRLAPKRQTDSTTHLAPLGPDSINMAAAQLVMRAKIDRIARSDIRSYPDEVFEKALHSVTGHFEFHPASIEALKAKF